MRRKNFFILIMMILGLGMTIRALFGGNPKSNSTTILQNESSGFVQELTNTGNILDSGNIQVDNQKKDVTEIRVMMPKYFYNSGWENFAEDLLNKQKVYIKFTFIDDLNSYRDLLYSTNFSEADLFLFPYDWNEKISTRSFSAEQSIKPYFDEQLYNILNENLVTFLPFAADPMIMYTITGYSSQNNFHSIFEYVLSREPEKPLSFPLFFGINTEDYNKTGGFKREYQDIVWYALMHYFKTNNDVHDLQTRIDSNSLQSYNIEDLNTIINAITSPECKYFPSICFQIYNFVGIRFGFLSDADIVNQYFAGRKDKFENLSKIPLPFAQLESPVRIRGRGMPSSLEDAHTVNGIYEFIKQYMNDYNEYNLRNSTLPVFRGEGNGLIDNEYIGIRAYILPSGGDYINTLRGTSKFWELIGYDTNMSAKDYLR